MSFHQINTLISHFFFFTDKLEETSMIPAVSPLFSSVIIYICFVYKLVEI